jgi:hypothetical protein
LDLLELLLELSRFDLLAFVHGRCRAGRCGCPERYRCKLEGTRKEVSFTSAASHPKIASKQALGASQLRLRSDLADKDVASLHFGTDTDDPSS